MTALTLHRARLVFPVHRPPIADGAVAVRGGRIVDVGPHDELVARFRDEDVVREEWAGILTPGLVNAHTHLQYTGMASVGEGAYTGFEDWSAAFQAVYEQPHDWAASAAAGAAALLRHGTTAAADVVTDPVAGSALHDAGLHGIAFWEVFGWKTPRWRAQGEARVRAELAAIPTPPATGISPHAVYSLDREVLREVAELARTLGLRQHIHAAESAFEDDYTRDGTGALAEHWRVRGHGDLELLAGGGSGLGAIAYLDSVGALAPETHLAHGVYVDADDRALLRARGVAVSLCPRSNAVIGLDAAPVAAYLRERSPVAVGTDSLASSPSLDVRDDLAALLGIARAQGYREADLHARLLHTATAGGAYALGLDRGSAPAGTLAPGSVADLAVFAVDATDPREALAAFVEDVASTPAVATIVDGVAHTSSRENTDVL